MYVYQLTQLIIDGAQTVHIQVNTFICAIHLNHNRCTAESTDNYHLVEKPKLMPVLIIDFVQNI